MPTLLQRIFGQPVETRSHSARVAPARSNSTVTASAALSLTAVYRAIQIIATPISKMELETYRYATGMERRIDNPLFVNKPSLDDTRRDFLFQTVASLALHGEAFWFKNFTNNGQVNNVVLLQTDLVQITQDDFGRKFFTYKEKTYPASDIEHLKFFSRVGELHGIGPIQACRPDIAAALDLRHYAATWFGQAGVPTGVLKTTQSINEEQADKVRQVWHEKQAERTIAVIGNGFDYQQVALNPKDALFTDVQNQSVQAIARLFGVPARLLLTGVDGTSDTYSNLQDENQVFYRHTLMAYTDPITDALSNCLPRGTRTEFNFEGLFKADVAARYAYYKTGIDAGFLLPEEVRRKEGLDA